MALPKIGNKGPAFSLLNQRGDTIKLSALRGKKVILYFYPRALTPGCTVQACGLRDTQVELQRHNAIVFGVSPDPVPKLQRFIEKHELNFDLLSDEDHQIADKYGVWGPKKFMGKEFMGIVRTTFVIDEQGYLQGILDKVKTKNHHQDVLAWLNTHGV